MKFSYLFSGFKDLGCIEDVFKIGKFVSKLEFLATLLFFIAFQPVIFCQEINVENTVSYYLESVESIYDVKRLNLKPRDIGSIFETEHVYTDFFQLRSIDKVPNSLIQNKRLKIYMHVFSYESEYLLENALRFWFDNFVAGEQIRPGRMLRGYDNARPMYVIINGVDVFMADIDCKSYDEDGWKKLTKSLRNHFDPNRSAIIIEVMCNGPLEWKQNPPNFRKR